MRPKAFVIEMRFRRQSRVVTALLALMSVLFMQLAVAAYACPTVTAGVESVHARLMQADDHADMAGCEGIVDIEQPSLCHAHAQFGDQSTGNAELPNLSPPLALTVIPVLQIVDAASPPDLDAVATPHLARASAPPLSIQHCCFRI